MANEIWTIKRCLEWTKEYLAFGEEHLLCEHAHAARRGDEQFAQGCADSGCECGVRFEALSDEPV